MVVEMEHMAMAIGVSVPVLRFLLCFVATLPVSLLCRVVPGGAPPKHLFAAASGAFLSYLSFGVSSNLHFLIPMLLGYASMALYRRRCGIITFFLGFAYLIGCHVYYMSGDAWKEGGIDATGALMVLVLKIWARSEKVRSPSPYGATIRALVQAAFCMGLHLYLVPQYPLSQFTETVYHEWGFWRRLGYQYMSGLTARWKYYFVWSISEAAVIISGLGFSGWTDSSPPKPRWDRAKNVDILGVEFAKTAAQIPLAWNIQVSTWLRNYVYERLIQKGMKPGFFQLLATQTVSAVWHGLYPGYIIFFVQSALMIAGSRVIYRWQQAIPPNMDLMKKVLVFLNFACTVLVLNYSCVGFMVLSLHETLVAYGSVYYIGTIVPIVFILLGHVIKPARPSRSKARKEQ
ncbi:MBOAT (membrane bound O-acyl transferase) family protein [Actinidia rufa]|uniref:MBOAT (Membrane bound O-acyl transferase) family protein n=1 Tax=Actinidia rufa TaxID=165716 RepID=A0A7J0FUA1_9ERIC|nr:MBOAT (membrane bound O-acyl transferase) family protein [Actinidia rufa]